MGRGSWGLHQKPKGFLLDPPHHQQQHMGHMVEALHVARCRVECVGLENPIRVRVRVRVRVECVGLEDPPDRIQVPVVSHASEEALSA